VYSKLNTAVQIDIIASIGLLTPKTNYIHDFGDYFSSNIVLGTPFVKYVVINATAL